MRETLDYTTVEGPRTTPDVTVYALSTCGFCKRALAFLNGHGFSYRYAYMDRIPLDEKNEIKRELKDEYGVDVAFPFAEIEGKGYLVGFVEIDWKKTLGVE